MSDIGETSAELAQLWPALAAALARDTAAADGPAASPAWTAVAVVNPDVLQALLTLDADVPAAVRHACEDISERWAYRDLPGCLRQIPRLAGRMHDLGHITAEKYLTWQADGWLRLVKRALGLRRPDMPIGRDCPYAADTPDAHGRAAGLILAGAEGFLDPAADVPVAWVTSGLIYCASDACGASWLKAEWSMLDRLLQATARDAA